MVSSEFNGDPLMEENYSDPNTHDEDEDDETLSFCDLSIYSSVDQSFSSSSTSSSSSSDQDFFDFYSQEWSPTSISYPVENIVFCGKLIPTRKPICSHTTVAAAADHKIDGKPENPKKQSLFRWNSKLFSRQRSSTNAKNTKSRCMNKTNQPPKLGLSVSNSPPPALGSGKCGYNAANGSEKYGFPVGRVSLVTAPAKSRWQLLVFGLAGVPAEMEFSDIRSRQRRQSPSPLFRRGSDEEKGGGGKGLWGLIKGLGCGGDGDHHQNSVVAITPRVIGGKIV